MEEINLATEYPTIAAEWHPTKNGLLRPEDVKPFSGKKVWWLGKCGHEWCSVIQSRTATKSSGCPYCSNKRVLIGFNDLASKRPDIASEWHPIKNGDLTPDQVTIGSRKRVWWRHWHSESKSWHEWQAFIYSRTGSSNTSCPYCSSVSVLSGFNDLSTINPSLAAEWDGEKNEPLTPTSVSPNSHKRVWWMHWHEPTQEWHRWKASIKSRNIDGVSCPFCSNKAVLRGFNDLASQHPEIATEWDFAKNGDLTPDQVVYGSCRKVWWKCSRCGLSWHAAISSRSQGTGCPECGRMKAAATRSIPNDGESIADRYPELVAEWHPTKNGDLTPNDIRCGSTIKIWWRCSYGHEWQATPGNRTYESSGCPVCSAHLKTSFPEQALFFYLNRDVDCVVENRASVDADEKRRELDIWIPEKAVGIEYDGVYWHRDRYERALEKDLAFQNEGVTVIHVIESNDNRSDGYNVFYSIEGDYRRANLAWAIRRVEEMLDVSPRGDIDPYNDRFDIMKLYRTSPLRDNLLLSYPELAEQWDPEKNGELKPETVSPHSGIRVWWRHWHAGTGTWHSWSATISNRTGVNHSNCPYCSGKKVLAGFNDLASQNPSLAAEWHPTKNGDLTAAQVTLRSGKKVWWRHWCADSKSWHEWQAFIYNRVKSQGCPYCSGNRVLVGFNDLASRRPDFAEEWHPSKNGSLTPEQLTLHSNKKVWWICKYCGESWQASPNTRRQVSWHPKCKYGKRGQTPISSN